MKIKKKINENKNASDENLEEENVIYLKISDITCSNLQLN